MIQQADSTLVLLNQIHRIITTSCLIVVASIFWLGATIAYFASSKDSR